MNKQVPTIDIFGLHMVWYGMVWYGIWFGLHCCMYQPKLRICSVFVYYIKLFVEAKNSSISQSHYVVKKGGLLCNLLVTCRTCWSVKAYSYHSRTTLYDYPQKILTMYNLNMKSNCLNLIFFNTLILIYPLYTVIYICH